TGRPPLSDATLLDQALVLCADHELAPATFVARVAASAAANLYACVSAALATSCHLEGNNTCVQLERLLGKAFTPSSAHVIVDEHVAAGRVPPGFSHPLYPDGDPRAPPLLEAARKRSLKRPRVQALLALVDAMRDTGQGAPTLELGLVALCESLRLPAG